MQNKANMTAPFRDYDQVIKLDSNDAIGYVNRGISYAEQGEYDRAIRDFDQALRLDPNDAAAYINRGEAYGVAKASMTVLFKTTIRLSASPPAMWRLTSTGE